VGERLARFHAETERVGGGGAEPVKRWLDDTHASLRGLLTSAAERGLVARAERFAAVFLTARWDQLESRAREGRVRDGHGDLRAEHVVLEHDGIRIVDCIEFDAALREIDVSSDLAFLVMDLEATGRSDLARCLVESYRGAGGDPGDDALLYWFAAYRAQVRAKVALLRAAQQSGDERRRSKDGADRLLAVGDRLLWRAHGPVTIAVGGLAASGKTTLAAALASRTGFPHLSSDAARKAQAGLAATARGSADLYTPERNTAVYAELGRRAATSAEGAVVDATFRARGDREVFGRAHAPARRILHVECVTPAAERLRRARARERDADRISDADAAVAQAQTMDALDEVAPADHVVVRGDGAIDAQVDAVADALDRALAARSAR
jgi:predicted kinase